MNKNLLKGLGVLLISSFVISCDKKSDPEPDNLGPNVSITFVDGVIKAKATDSDGSISKVELIYNGSVVQTDKTSPYEFTETFIDGNTYTYKVKAYDNEGLSKTANITFTYSAPK